MSLVHLISFADGAFADRKETFTRQAGDMAMYDSVTVNDMGTIPADFAETHRLFFEKEKRGFGYWLWKPAIILDRLKSMDPEDVLVYADIGFTQNPLGRARMLDYIEIVRKSEFGLLSFMHPYTEYNWTKQDLAVRLDVADDPRIMATSQLGGGLMVLMRNNHTIDLLNEWIQIAIEDDYHYLTDAPSRAPNDPRFIEHRHDQSISSLLRKIRGTEITFYETENYPAVFGVNILEWPMLATRSRV